MKKIFINSGHCIGYDCGAVNNYYGVTEADIVRDIGRILADRLTEYGYEVELEQSDNLCGNDGHDWFDSVCYHANDWEADIFVSLHCNAFNTRANGTEVWYCSERGKVIANSVQKKLIEVLGTVNRGIKQSNKLWVLKFTDAPAILIEIAFVDNNADCELLLNCQYEIASAIANGIKEITE